MVLNDDRYFAKYFLNGRFIREVSIIYGVVLSIYRQLIDVSYFILAPVFQRCMLELNILVTVIGNIDVSCSSG